MTEKMLAVVISLVNIVLAYSFYGADIALFVLVYCFLSTLLIFFKNRLGLMPLNTFIFLKILPESFGRKIDEIKGWILLFLPTVIMLFLIVKNIL